MPPTGGGLVEAAIPGDPVAAVVLDDAGLLVEDTISRDRLAIGIVAGNGDLHDEKASRGHPDKKFQRVGESRVR